jgi:hypothetical protein
MPRARAAPEVGDTPATPHLAGKRLEERAVEGFVVELGVEARRVGVVTPDFLPETGSVIPQRISVS